MLDKDHVAAISRQHAAHLRVRRELMTLASAAQNEAKRAIFALHRDDLAGADALLAASDEKLAKVRGLIAGMPELGEEGTYHAALEEHAEAALYRAFVKEGRIGPLAIEGLSHDAYIGALADLAGELQRRQVRLATDGKKDEVRAIKDEIEAIIEAMLGMDLEGYLRTKFDQAKNSLRRAEDVLYELTVRRG